MMTRINDGNLFRRELQSSNPAPAPTPAPTNEDEPVPPPTGFNDFEVAPSGPTLYYKEDSAYNIQGCPDYEKAVFVGDGGTRRRFELWFREIEEQNKCSGVCNTAYKNPSDPDSTVSPFYLFSNVNNGKPKISCKEAIRSSVLKEA